MGGGRGKNRRWHEVGEKGGKNTTFRNILPSKKGKERE